MRNGLILFCVCICLGLLLIAGCDGGSATSSSSSSTTTTSSSTSSTSSSGYANPDNWELTGSLDVHDPAIIKTGSYYYIYGTGVGIRVKRSSDGLYWSNIGKVFSTYPSWANTYVPNHESNIWAPDIQLYNGTYYLYYSISSFGSNTSAIGLATTTNLASGWTDKGLVIRSTSSDNYNCIDPNLVVDQSGRAWLAFGSFWSGLKLIELDTATMKPKSGATLYSLATRSNTAIEAAFIVYRNGYYYLFASVDYCCQGVNSTYKIIYGRSSNITGTYYDKSGVSMMNGGGSLFDDGNDRWRGPGGQSLLGTDTIAHHAYDADNNGTATLMIKNVHWDSDGWPYRGDDDSVSSSSSTSSTSTSSTSSSGCN